jgi:Ser/Thr protein kinase RdoA (MazF antagonist)
VAAGVAARMGRPEPELIRRGMNHVYGGRDMIIRVSVTDDAARQVAIAVEMASLGISCPMPLTEPEVIDELAVTVWERIIPTLDAVVDYRQVGEAIAVLHSTDITRIARVIEPAWFGAPAWLQLDELCQTIEARQIVADADLDVLRHHCQTYGDWQQAASEEPLVLCHGDLHPDNAIQTDHGPVILDWDGLCVGPSAWDHAPLFSWTRAWGGGTSTYSDFAGGYGADLGDSPLTNVLSNVRLLAATLNLILSGEHHPARAAEARRRMAYWRGEPNPPAWRAQ